MGLIKYQLNTISYQRVVLYGKTRAFFSIRKSVHKHKKENVYIVKPTHTFIFVFQQFHVDYYMQTLQNVKQ